MQIKVPFFLMFIFQYSFHCKAHVSTNKHLNMSKKKNYCIFKGDEGRPTFALSKLHWGAFREANEKQDK